MPELCLPCEHGDHTDCDWPCECSHTCHQCSESGGLLGGCKCDRELDQARGK